MRDVVNFFIMKKLAADECDDEALFSFADFMPIPDGVDEYDWCVKHWGTKWDATDVEVSFESDKAVFTFCTAWNEPSCELISAIEARFCNVTVELYASYEGEEEWDEDEEDEDEGA